jgi:hypothetical protein
VNDDEQHLSKVLPKAAFIIQPTSSTIIRGAYTRAISGASFDESIRLEPTQLAGFNQASRTDVSESLIGSIAGAEYETYGLSLEQKLPTSTYWSVEVNSVHQDFNRTVGVFDFLVNDVDPFAVGALPGSLGNKVIYREDNFIATFNQLLGNEWSLGARYQISKSTFRSIFGALKDAAADLRTDPTADQTNVAAIKRISDSRESSVLHQLSLFALWNHPSGFFARAEANWYSQENDGFPLNPAKPRNDPTPGDDFWQLNLYAGYRFFRNQCELEVGVLNLTDQDYRLEPLNYYLELPRDRTFFARVKLSF